MRCHGEVERLDERLASCARVEAALRLRLGQVLEVLGRGKHFELGFSSIAAYALERCDRSVRWVEAARCLARRLEALPVLRRALAFGNVSWSMGELLARVAQPGDEAHWIEAAKSRTVREMKELLLDATRGERCKGVGVLKDRVAGSAAFVEQAVCDVALGARTTMPQAPAGEHSEDDDGDEMCTLTCTVDREEAWLFEATRALLEQLGVQGADAQVEALLAEGQDTLLAALAAGGLSLEGLEGADTSQQAWLRELSRWRIEAEVLCEKNFWGSVAESRVSLDPKQAGGAHAAGGVAEAAAHGLGALASASCRDLDGMLKGLSRSLARHELELSELVLQFHRVDGWRRLGYASETQYARERLGMSRSSLMARRALALRLEKLPRVAKALGAGQIGVEAALSVVRVATPSTQAAWVERARQRTIKHLREEVVAALVAVRWSGEAGCPPPVDGEMAAFHELERAVVSGRACQPRPANDCPVNEGSANDCPVNEGPVNDCTREGEVVRLAEPSSAPRRAWLVMLGSLAGWLQNGVQLSAAGGGARASSVASKGRVTLRWRVSRANHGWWRGLEARARHWLPSGMSWLRFLCLSLWSAWRHLLGTSVAYGQIYIRDRFRCSSPVCNRRDVTPHHLHFRSAGGSDADENVAAVCTWCHLFGVHGGRIRAAGTAERIRWELGAPGCPCLVVDGRERVAA